MKHTPHEIIIKAVNSKAADYGYKKGNSDFEKNKEYHDNPPSVKEILKLYELSDLGIDGKSEDVEKQINFAHHVFCSAYQEGYEDGWGIRRKKNREAKSLNKKEKQEEK